MPQAKILRWRDSRGWLVLAGSQDEDIEAQALERSPAGRPLAYVYAASDVETADRELERLEDLGAPTGYLVDVLTEDDDTVIQHISDAGIIVLGDGSAPDQLRNGLLGAASQGLGSALDFGALLLAEGIAVQVLGTLLSARPDAKRGLGWVDNIAIMPYFEREDARARLTQILVNQPDAIGLGIGSGSALALGPNGEVEAWGRQQITVILGSSFQ
jgi:hypothetical protein